MLLCHLHQQHHPAAISQEQVLQQEDLLKSLTTKIEKQEKMEQLSCNTKMSSEDIVIGSDTEVQCAGIQQCSDEPYKEDELVIATSHPKTSAMHDQGACYSMERTASKSFQDEQSKLNLTESNTVKRDQPSPTSDTSNKETGNNDHIQQCKQVGRDELVIAASSYTWYSHDHIHTIACRYCREEVNSCYYGDHLVNCLESNKCRQGHCSLNNRHNKTTRGYILPDIVATKHGVHEFVVNCTAMEESFNQ